VEQCLYINSFLAIRIFLIFLIFWPTSVFVFSYYDQTNIRRIVAFLCWEQFNPAYIIGTDREFYNVKLGKNIDNEEKFLAAVKSCSWFAASVDDTTSYSLVGCIVYPGFDYQDWKLGNVEALAKLYPLHKSTIEKYTRN
jgi:predicted cupin superfamily sugar epimerase